MNKYKYLSFNYRCLDEANWNFEKALEIFLQLTENNEIPDAAFN